MKRLNSKKRLVKKILSSLLAISITLTCTTVSVTFADDRPKQNANQTLGQSTNGDWQKFLEDLAGQSTNVDWRKLVEDFGGISTHIANLFGSVSPLVKDSGFTQGLVRTLLSSGLEYTSEALSESNEEPQVQIETSNSNGECSDSNPNACSVRQLDRMVERLRKIQTMNYLKGKKLSNGPKGIVAFSELTSKISNRLMLLITVSYIVSSLHNLIGSIDVLSNYVYPIYNWFNNLIFKFTRKGINIRKYETLLARIKERLKVELVGQDEAIDEIMNVMRGHFEAVLEAEHAGRKYEKGLLLYFVGTPATGKTTVLKIIAEEMGLRPYIAGMSDVVKDKGNQAVTAADRLFKPTLYNNGQRIVEVKSDLQRHLGIDKPSLFCLDEFDKMRNFDIMNRNANADKNLILSSGGSLDEVARSFMDSGELFGKKTPNSILVLTSNETDEDLKKLENSLYNRYRNGIVKFKDLTADAYKEIIKRQFSNVKKFYKEKFNVDVIWDEKATDLLAQQFEKENLGARAVEVLVNKARSAIAIYRDAYSKNNKFKDMSIVLGCESDSQKLIVNRL